MAMRWHPSEGVAATKSDLDNMAQVLEGQHGAWAAEMAEFFALLHGQKGDALRSWAWNGVAEAVRRREAARRSLRG